MDNSSGGVVQIAKGICEVNGKKVGYLIGGSGPGVLFVHGWAANPGMYFQALLGVAQLGFRVIAPYLPGSGASEFLYGKGSTPSQEQIAQWLNELLVGINFPPLRIVAGHSLGGGLATTYAFLYRENIEHLLLLSSVGGHANSDGELIELRSSIEWSLSIPIDLAVTEISPKHVISMVGGGLAQFVRDPVGLWRLSKLARNYQLCNELNGISKTGIKISVVGARSDRVISRSSVVRLAKCAGVEPIWVSGTHSWISSHPDQLVDLISNL